MDIKKEINKARLTNSNKWYFLTFEENGKKIQVKGFNTWLQIFRIDGVNYPSLMDIKVKDFLQHIESALNN